MDHNIHHKRALILLEQGRYVEAEKELRLALELEPANAQIYNDLSICKAEAKDYQQARQLAEQAIALEPSNPNYLYSLSRVLYLSHHGNEARLSIHAAISLFPYASEYFNLAGRIEFEDGNFAKALEYANTGLEIDAENINCLNLRSSSLLKLNRKEEAFSTIQDALYFDPHNAYTHANLGWTTLEKGKANDALTHFRNALQIEPNNRWAKLGMVEAMKGQYWIYNWFLKYSFWMSKNGKNFRWFFIIGFMLLSWSAGAIYPPMITFFVMFALMSWIMSPLSNLFLRLNKYGRYALTKEDIWVSNLVGSSLLVFMAGLGTYLSIQTDWALALTFFGFTMMIPLSSMFTPVKDRDKKILKSYAILLGSLGSIAVVALALQNPIGSALSVVYIFALFTYQWTANFLIAR